LRLDLCEDRPGRNRESLERNRPDGGGRPGDELAGVVGVRAEGHRYLVAQARRVHERPRSHDERFRPRGALDREAGQHVDGVAQDDDGGLRRGVASLRSRSLIRVIERTAWWTSSGRMTIAHRLDGSAWRGSAKTTTNRLKDLGADG
jgi:hypothetical protein